MSLYMSYMSNRNNFALNTILLVQQQYTKYKRLESNHFILTSIFKHYTYLYKVMIIFIWAHPVLEKVCKKQSLAL